MTYISLGFDFLEFAVEIGNVIAKSGAKSLNVEVSLCTRFVYCVHDAVD